MRVVLDTNVLISGLNFPGNARAVLDLARRGRFEWYLSPFIFREVEGVLTRKFGWDEAMTARAVAMLRDAATMIEPVRRPPAIETSEASEADSRSLECAAAACADYLVTGDRRHLLPLGEHAGVRIVNAPRFLSSLEE